MDPSFYDKYDVKGASGSKRKRCTGGINGNFGVVSTKIVDGKSNPVKESYTRGH